MAKVVVTFTIMPTSPDVELTVIEEKAKKEITSFVGKTGFKVEQKPVAFGLKSLNILFLVDEEKGSTEALEKKIAALDGVSSCEVTDVRRAIG